ncbi:hypothetical protein EV13_0192 [Prochlorococcus sp. MIT 0702]|nr:hypothetical protein EV12_0203 [Prochlorococcus sp. MIT 0701]KGG30532.1 hypothetical protein EV13_0192 [Prochlorococcus sp. MIT 0702]KGG37048.1 hypothetical protein EV14_0148 [Prochlorococcus sp. MIT 0703]
MVAEVGLIAFNSALTLLNKPFSGLACGMPGGFLFQLGRQWF